ncbi:MAG: hypothetical protein EOM91_03630 [Sphingobacteriia bacterium]|nr:hypothetical protein [Sphingobacteriia bacterium]NCC39762.1 hypothetical protein [Gammaproteobacteria bacterium]
MKTKLIITINAILFAVAWSALASPAIDPNRLEPCINGQVSASGLYPTQAEEDAALAEAKRQTAGLQEKVSAAQRLINLSAVQ